MRLSILVYAIGSFLFFAVVIAVIVQNLGWKSSEFSALWMNLTLTKLILLVSFCSMVAGVMLYQAVKSFFTGMQRAELTKFDLDKPA